MNKKLTTKIEEAQEVALELEKLGEFSRDNSFSPPKVYEEAVSKMEDIVSSLNDYIEPKTRGELIESELRRRLIGEAAEIEKRLSGKLIDFDSTLRLYGIPQQDIDELEPWLLKNKDKVLETVERLYRKFEGSNNSHLGLDIWPVRREIENFASSSITRFHKKLGKFLQGFTQIGNYLRDINAVPTSEARSYFNFNTNELAIGIEAICKRTKEGLLKLDHKQLIRLYGHEGMGHALNFILSRCEDLPHFLSKESSFVESTAESVAQFYERQLLEDIKDSDELQRDLEIAHLFEEIYQDSSDKEYVDRYGLKLTQYATRVLADRSLGDHKDSKVIDKRKGLIKRVALYRNHATYIVENSLDHYDSQGNYSEAAVSELRYCANPVRRALDIFTNGGIEYKAESRDTIDQALLTGFWTSKGFVDNARIIAQKNTKE